MLSLLFSAIPGVGPILSAGASFLSGNWKILAGIAGAVAIGVFVWSWDSRGQQISGLEEVNATLQANLADTKRMLELSKQANAAATARIEDAAKTQVSLDHITEDALHADKTKDGPIAPVLRDTLDAIARLRNPPTNH